MEGVRNIAIIEYLERLQLEYFVSELRSKIYPRVRDKKYYRRVMDGKREKIEDISEKNGIPNIFNSKKIQKQFRSNVYLPEGLPCFHYFNEEKRRGLEEPDFSNYYQIGSDVKIKTAEGIELGKIKSVAETSIEVQLTDSVEVREFNQVTRIL